ncbi:phage tail protein [Fulvivirga ligni]|uniref:phage tail protein n=1 Tax=Fulvivirga ligni TaxID=2904246 RepID=UPI001F44A538|nr:phage tail protein [Fulvivirga ligni]UII19391.1 phage tail protein [Fulvivirga ligni]
MKNFVLILLFVITNVAFSQNSDCDCSDALMRDTQIINNWQNVQQFYYKYFLSDKQTRRKMRKSSATGINVSLLDIIDVGLDGASNSNSNFISTLKQILEQQGYFSEENYESLYTSVLSTNALNAYIACLNSNACAGTGVKSQVFGDPDDLFTVQLVYLDNANRPHATIQSITYSNCVPFGLNTIINGTKIKDGQSKAQAFKRLSNDRPATVTFTFQEAGIRLNPIVIKGTRLILSEKMPIGAIVVSILDYTQFNTVNNLPIVFNSTSSTWAPCDGRPVTGSQYATTGATHSPDLRGLFLRGVNEMYNNNLGAGPTNNLYLNTANKRAGQLQEDAVGQHRHRIDYPLERSPWGVNYMPEGHWGTAGHQNAGFSGGTGYKTYTKEDGQLETRPKNMSVYYYIRIN